MIQRLTGRMSRRFPLVMLPVFFILLSSLTILPAFALDNKKNTDKASNPSPGKVAFVVTNVTSDRGKYSDRAKIGDKIMVKVDSLAALIKLAGDDVDNIKLKINDIVFSNLKPLRKVDEHTLEYELLRNDKNSAQWDSLSAGEERMVFPVRVSLANENLEKGKQKIVGYDYKLIVQTFRTGTTMVVVTAVIVGLTFFKLGKFDARLRSYGPGSAYSLALVQMAVWYCVVTLAYIYLYTINGCPPTLNSSITILIGISSATALGARIVDSSNISKKESQSAENASGSKLHSVLKNNDLSEKVEKLGSNGFFRDILSDEYGYALSRYQIVIWTLIMLYIFCKDVLILGVLHDFSEGELLLMGISSGSYVGYKLKEDPSKRVK
jgi:hypothetical protein